VPTAAEVAAELYRQAQQDALGQAQAAEQWRREEWAGLTARKAAADGRWQAALWSLPIAAARGAVVGYAAGELAARFGH
jgi:hypothetical protein